MKNQIIFNVTGVVNDDSSTQIMDKAELIDTFETLIKELKEKNCDAELIKRGNHLLIIQTQIVPGKID